MSLRMKKLLTAAAVGSVIAMSIGGCADDAKSPEIKGKFESSAPPAGYIDERMKNRTSNKPSIPEGKTNK